MRDSAACWNIPPASYASTTEQFNIFVLISQDHQVLNKRKLLSTKPVLNFCNGSYHDFESDFLLFWCPSTYCCNVGQADIYDWFKYIFKFIAPGPPIRVDQAVDAHTAYFECFRWNFNLILLMASTIARWKRNFHTYLHYLNWFPHLPIQNSGPGFHGSWEQDIKQVIDHALNRWQLWLFEMIKFTPAKAS